MVWGGGGGDGMVGRRGEGAEEGGSGRKQWLLLDGF
jgi:hypothetical protein